MTEEDFDRAWDDGIPVDIGQLAPSPSQEDLLVPQNGWQPADFPQITVAMIPYTSEPMYRADPYMTITEEGWLFIEVGNVRVALPDEEEWDKLTNMVGRMFNTWRAQRAPAPPPEPDKESDDVTDSVNGSKPGDLPAPDGQS